MVEDEAKTTNAKKRGRGRPRKLQGDTTAITLRLSVQELEKLETDAKAAGMKRSDWLRLLINSEPHHVEQAESESQ